MDVEDVCVSGSAIPMNLDATNVGCVVNVRHFHFVALFVKKPGDSCALLRASNHQVAPIMPCTVTEAVCTSWVMQHHETTTSVKTTEAHFSCTSSSITH